MNRLGQRGPTMLEWHGEVYQARAEAFGWHAIQIDGQDVEAVNAAYKEASSVTDKPVCIIAKTKKGAGVSFIADVEGYHGKAVPAADLDKALAELGNPAGDIQVQVNGYREGDPTGSYTTGTYVPPTYELGVKVATREAYGDALKALGAAYGHVVAIDGEVSNSTFADKFKKVYPDRFMEVYIAEQQLVSAAIGLQVIGKAPFASTFAAFFARAYDQIRMGAISRVNIKLAGSHAGVSIGEDGASQMALEDLAMMRSVHGSTVLYPSCATTAAALMGDMVNRDGIVYMRTTREKLPVLYSSEEQFSIGGSKIVRSSDNDKAAVIGAGITLHEAIKAADQLAAEGINIRVIDLYSLKPIDADTLRTSAKECNNTLIVVEDHWAEGGLADAVNTVFMESGADHPVIKHLCVTEMPSSGKPAELLAAAKIDAAAIVAAVKAL